MHRGKPPEQPRKKSSKRTYAVVEAAEANARTSKRRADNARRLQERKALAVVPSPMSEVRKNLADALKTKKHGSQIQMKGIAEGNKKFLRVQLTPSEAYHAEFKRTNNPVKALNNIKHLLISRKSSAINLTPSNAYRTLLKKAEKAGITKIPSQNLYAKFNISNMQILEMEIDRLAHLHSKKPAQGMEKSVVLSAIQNTVDYIQTRENKR